MQDALSISRFSYAATKQGYSLANEIGHEFVLVRGGLLDHTTESYHRVVLANLTTSIDVTGCVIVETRMHHAPGTHLTVK